MSKVQGARCKMYNVKSWPFTYMMCTIASFYLSKSSNWGCMGICDILKEEMHCHIFVFKFSRPSPSIFIIETNIYYVIYIMNVYIIMNVHLKFSHLKSSIKILKYWRKITVIEWAGLFHSSLAAFRFVHVLRGCLEWHASKSLYQSHPKFESQRRNKEFASKIKNEWTRKSVYHALSHLLS